MSSVLTLAESWSFTLYNESRNEKFIENLCKAGFKLPGISLASNPRYSWDRIDSTCGYNAPICKLTLPEDTVLHRRSAAAR